MHCGVQLYSIKNRLPGYQFVMFIKMCKCAEVAIPMNNSESAFGKVIALSADNDENQKLS